MRRRLPAEQSPPKQSPCRQKAVRALLVARSSFLIKDLAQMYGVYNMNFCNFNICNCAKISIVENRKKAYILLKDK